MTIKQGDVFLRGPETSNLSGFDNPPDRNRSSALLVLEMTDEHYIVMRTNGRQFIWSRRTGPTGLPNSFEQILAFEQWIKLADD
jgi:hypothetical protein